MRKVTNPVFLLILIIAVVMSGCADKDSNPANTMNKPPNVPSNPTPTDNSVEQSVTVELCWNCGDPNNDLLSYDIYLDTRSSPRLVKGDLAEPAFTPGQLRASTTYYWKVTAKDSREISTEGPVWRFTTSAPENKPPVAPHSPSPSDQSIRQSTAVHLNWACSDPEGDPLTYDIYLGSTSDPQLVKAGETTTSYDPGTLDTNTTYYWKVLAKDNKSHSAESPVWRFTTAPPNRAPNVPSNPSPIHLSTDQPINTILSWECSDPDGDTLTYDIYFGSFDVPILVKWGEVATTYNPGRLNAFTTYYWKIVAKDGMSHQTEGPVWSFTTAAPLNEPPSSPFKPSPPHQSFNQSTLVTLSWSCTDPDNDPLTYDVYFGTFAPPPLMTLRQRDTTYDPGILTVNSNYYWQIVARDDHSHVTAGPIWSFSTCAVIGERRIINGAEFIFVKIPAGNFYMGSPESEVGHTEYEAPVHNVAFAESFWMLNSELTQRQYQAITGSNPSSRVGDNLPVEMVSWKDCQTFLATLNSADVGKEYRLPSEAEWEYACRAGKISRFHWGEDPNYTEIGKYTWFWGNSDRMTKPVKTKLPNAWGLYDMNGNVHEWCEDDWHKNYPRAPANGKAWVEEQRGAERVIRGGSWYYDHFDCRSASRSWSVAVDQTGYVGFRLVSR